MLLQVHDLLAIEVNDPAGFSPRLEAKTAAALHPIQPICLQPSVRIADCLRDYVWLMVAHFPWESDEDEDIDHRALCLETSCGLRRMVNVPQGKPILVIQIGPAVTACMRLVFTHHVIKCFVE